MAVTEIKEPVEQRRNQDIVGLLDPADVVDDLRRPLESAASVWLSQSLDKAGDALFNRARRCEAGTLRESCHDAVRALHRHRKTIDRHFRQALDECFHCGFDKPARPASGQTGSQRQRDVVQDDAIVEATANRVRAQHHAKLEELERRLSYIVPLDEAGGDNPFDPAVILRSFGAALRAVGIETRPRLVVYRAFENELLTSLGEVYDTLVAELEAAGLIPQTQVPVTEQAATNETTAEAGDGAVPNGSDDRAATNDAGSEPSSNVHAEGGGNHQSSASAESITDAGDVLRLVRQQVRVVVESKLDREPDLPQELPRFLRQTWCDAMVVEGVRFGVSSNRWYDNKHVMERLVAVMRPQTNEADRQAAERELPEVMTRMQRALRAVMEESTLISEITDHLLDAFNRVNGPDRPETPKGGRRASTAVRGELPDNVLVAEFTSDGASQPASQPFEQADEETRRELATIPVCSWFVFIDSQGQQCRACLQARLDGGYRYVFADRHGDKIAEYSLDELALAVETGNAVPLEEATEPGDE